MVDSSEISRRQLWGVIFGGVIAIVVAMVVTQTTNNVVLDALSFLVGGCGLVALGLGGAGLVTYELKRLGAKVQRSVSGEIDAPSHREMSSGPHEGSPLGVRALLDSDHVTGSGHDERDAGSTPERDSRTP